MLEGSLEAAHEDYKQSNFNDATSTLSNFLDDPTTEKPIKAVAYHNLGCVKAAEGKPHTSVLMLSHAVQETTNANHKAQSLYLAGVQHLHLQHYELAAECLATAARSIQENPALWLRFAECCICLMPSQKNHNHASISTSGSAQPNENESALSAAGVEDKNSTTKPEPRLDIDAAKLYLQQAKNVLAKSELPQNEKDTIQKHIDECSSVIAKYTCI